MTQPTPTNPFPVPPSPFPGPCATPTMLTGTATYPPAYETIPHFCGGIPGDDCECADWLAECAAAFRSPLRIDYRAGTYGATR